MYSLILKAKYFVFFEPFAGILESVCEGVLVERRRNAEISCAAEAEVEISDPKLRSNLFADCNNVYIPIVFMYAVYLNMDVGNLTFSNSHCSPPST